MFQYMLQYGYTTRKARAKVLAYTGAFPLLRWKLLVVLSTYSVRYEQLGQ